ncbi:MAG: PglZ domain-containing protein [Salinivirgaceae bacterium]|nr:PglZ domain-containing protein [Salinivirgaceae bacterium]MDD4746560.1 PglZ domain-containing protein [Salinivirgaceae bacterium]MDY0279616.1 PglZ domain-containing protein [Salinivirgaceae bacterium]
MQNQIQILWVDDEIEFLKSHILFLESKGYAIKTVNSAIDALEILQKQKFDIIFLDENMPGMTGLEMLDSLRNTLDETPVVMITKSEEERIMESALGNNIKDYLIKPVNPNQILMAIKKITDHRKLRSAKTTTDYQTAFRELGTEIYDCRTSSDWYGVYKKLIWWELALQDSGSPEDMQEILLMQKTTANTEFAKFIKKNYESWFAPKFDERPIMSPSVLKHHVFPHLGDDKVMIIVIDNLRFDQWLAIKPAISKHYKVEKEEMYFSILPTATQYARNSLFSGLMPEGIKRTYPDLWRDEDDEGAKNEFEKDLFKNYLSRHGHKMPFYFEKASNVKSARKVMENPARFIEHSLSVLVYNFVDILSHARTDVDVIKELASSEPAYRNLTRSWYEHSPLSKLIEYLSQNKVRLFITTDHGSIKINNPVKIIGDRDTTTNLRYKHGKNLNYKDGKVFEVSKPEAIGLPRLNVSGNFVFACENDFFAYPNNYNYYVNYYKDTFQHGGVSLEEMLIPIISLTPNK